MFGLEYFLTEWLKTRSGRIVGSVVSCLATTVAVLLVVPIGVGQLRLFWTPTPVEAAVEQTQTYYDTTGRKATGHAVRYAFDAGPRRYHFRGPSGNEWASVPVAVMDDAARTRRIDVVYWAADPWNNLPAANLRWLWAWGVLFVTGPVVLAGLTWAWVARVARDEFGPLSR